MPRLRVRLHPDSHAVKTGLAVLGATLELASLGKGSTAVSVKAGRKPAVLRFLAAYLQSVRNDTPQALPFAQLAGHLDRRADGTPVFTFPPGAELVYAAPPEPTPPPHFELRLDYETVTFADVPPAEDAVHRLRLPSRPAGATHLEISAELSVDGGEEAPSISNEVLDVPLAPLSFFEALLLTPDGKPFADHPYRLELADGSIIEGKSDSAGLVQVIPVMKGLCVLHLGSLPSRIDA